MVGRHRRFGERLGDPQHDHARRELGLFARLAGLGHSERCLRAHFLVGAHLAACVSRRASSLLLGQKRQVALGRRLDRVFGVAGHSELSRHPCPALEGEGPHAHAHGAIVALNQDHTFRPYRHLPRAHLHAQGYRGRHQHLALGIGAPSACLLHRRCRPHADCRARHRRVHRTLREAALLFCSDVDVHTLSLLYRRLCGLRRHPVELCRCCSVRQCGDPRLLVLDYGGILRVLQHHDRQFLAERPTRIPLQRLRAQAYVEEGA
mmetsp:Transcript_46462/g.133805  ORF Transcript_46462/g.133805 Transcript_46462/m.133805 type:complete len:263 (+) Transcript_46462:919-1707(+)